MPALTRRRDPVAREERWRVFYGDVQAGASPDFFTARAAFETAWRRLLPTVTPAYFGEYRRERARTAWKYAMWDAGCRMPTQLPSGRSRCFCGAEIDIAGTDQHVYTVHMVSQETA